jgi:hypothetical protein
MKNRANANACKIAYQIHAAEITQLLGLLQTELRKHAQAAKGDHRNWGKVGDLGKVKNDLIETVAFLKNVDRAQIQNFLFQH